MDCIINKSMFVRSNGNIVCWDDGGCNKVIQQYDVNKDYANDVYFGRPYNEIRASLSKNIMPHGNICASCHMLNAAKDFDHSASSKKIIQWLQVESSFACQLACPNCYPGIIRRDAVSRTDAGHLNLSLDAYKKIVGSLAQGEIDIKEINFERHGEPLLNPRIWDMIRYTKLVYPNSFIRIVTNSNFVFNAEMATCGVAQMVFAIDGVHSELYLKYRAKGKFDTCYKFMENFCYYVKSNDLPVNTVWKYVIFEHNDLEEDLEKLASDSELFGLKDVLIVITQSGPSSSKFFRALCDAWELSSTDLEARKVLQSLQSACDVAVMSSILERLIGWSPFPAALLSKKDRGPRFRVACYSSFDQSLDANLIKAETALNPNGDYNLALPTKTTIEFAGLAINAFAVKLTRLYERRTDMLTPSHYRLACRAMLLLPFIPPNVRFDTAWRLASFIRNCIDNPFPQSQFLVPVKDVEELEYGLYEIFRRRSILPSVRELIENSCREGSHFLYSMRSGR